MSSEPSASTRVAESFESVESDWVLDSLIGFLNGPVWQHPLLIFCEQKSVGEYYLTSHTLETVTMKDFNSLRSGRRRVMSRGVPKGI